MVKFWITALLVFVSNLIWAQNAINGVVLDEKEEPVGFCHVINKSMGMGKVSDRSGKFQIPAKKGDTLHFSYVGYKPLDIVVSSVHIVNYLKVSLPEDSLLLPSITIYADRYYKVPINHQGAPIRMQGVTVDDMTPRIVPGKFTPGVTGVGGVPVVGGTIYGPITYFSRDEREKRKAADAYEETRETITYQKFVAQDSVRIKLCRLYRLNDDQYDELIVRLNRQFPGIQRQYNPVEIWNWLLVHFDRQAPIIRDY